MPVGVSTGFSFRKRRAREEWATGLPSCLGPVIVFPSNWPSNFDSGVVISIEPPAAPAMYSFSVYPPKGAKALRKIFSFPHLEEMLRDSPE
jgi:hypothetical protein